MVPNAGTVVVSASVGPVAAKVVAVVLIVVGVARRAEGLAGGGHDWWINFCRASHLSSFKTRSQYFVVSSREQ